MLILCKSEHTTIYRLAQQDISEIGYPYSGHLPPFFQIHFATILYSITILQLFHHYSPVVQEFYYYWAIPLYQS